MTIFPCPVVKVGTIGIPRMCDNCDLLRHIIPTFSLSQPFNMSICSTCVLGDVNATQKPCTGCMVYTIIHQNIFSKQWNDIRLAVTPTPIVQTYHLLNSPTPMVYTHTHRACRQGIDIRFNTVPQFVSTQTQTDMAVHLALIQHTHLEVISVI